jgi:hypothetical protein
VASVFLIVIEQLVPGSPFPSHPFGPLGATWTRADHWPQDDDVINMEPAIKSRPRSVCILSLAFSRLTQSNVEMLLIYDNYLFFCLLQVGMFIGGRHLEDVARAESHAN